MLRKKERAKEGKRERERMGERVKSDMIPFPHQRRPSCVIGDFFFFLQFFLLDNFFLSFSL